MTKSTIASDPKTKRLNLELPGSAYKRVKTIEQLTEAASVSEVLRRSLTLYDYLISAQKNGERVILRSGDSEREIVVLD